MANGFVGFLEKVGKDVKVALEVVLPDVVRAAQIAEPVIDLALPAVGGIYNTVVNAAVITVQGYTALGVDATPEQIAAAVLKQTQGTMLPALEKAGLTSDQATAVMQSYIAAILTILNGPLSGGATPAQTSTGQVAPASSDPAPAVVAGAAPIAAVVEHKPLAAA